MDLKKIERLPKKYSKKKQEKQWQKIFSQRSEMIFEIWNERNMLFKILIISFIFHFVQFGFSVYLSKLSSENIKLIWTRIGEETGAIVGTDVITKSNMKPEEKEIRYFISEFILNVRTVPMDKNFYNNKIQDQSIFLTNASQEKLNNMIKNEGILTLISERKTSSAKIISVNKITSSNDTYQVRWSEDIFGTNGEKIETRNFIGVFTTDYANMKTEKEILKNPLGIVIKDFSVSRENN